VLKLSENPPVLFPEAESLEDIAGAGGRWWVGHTKARCEKAFAWDLHKYGVPYFLPMIQRVMFSGGRKRGAMMPLFSSYVFFCGGEEARYRALVTNRLCQVISVPDQKKLVVELRNIDVALRGKATLDPYPFATVGRRCRVKSGPFLGIEGRVVERNSITSLVLEVSLLGQAVALQIDTDVLEGVNEAEEIDLPATKNGRAGRHSARY